MVKKRKSTSTNSKFTTNGSKLSTAQKRGGSSKKTLVESLIESDEFYSHCLNFIEKPDLLYDKYGEAVSVNFEEKLWPLFAEGGSADILLAKLCLSAISCLYINDKATLIVKTIGSDSISLKLLTETIIDCVLHDSDSALLNACSIYFLILFSHLSVGNVKKVAAPLVNHNNLRYLDADSLKKLAEEYPFLQTLEISHEAPTIWDFIQVSLKSLTQGKNGVSSYFNDLLIVLMHQPFCRRYLMVLVKAFCLDIEWDVLVNADKKSAYLRQLFNFPFDSIAGAFFYPEQLRLMHSKKYEAVQLQLYSMIQSVPSSGDAISTKALEEFCYSGLALLDKTQMNKLERLAGQFDEHTLHQMLQTFGIAPLKIQSLDRGLKLKLVVRELRYPKNIIETWQSLPLLGSGFCVDQTNRLQYLTVKHYLWESFVSFSHSASQIFKEDLAQSLQTSDPYIDVDGNIKLGCPYDKVSLIEKTEWEHIGRPALLDMSFVPSSIKMRIHCENSKLETVDTSNVGFLVDLKGRIEDINSVISHSQPSFDLITEIYHVNGIKDAALDPTMTKNGVSNSVVLSFDPYTFQRDDSTFTKSAPDYQLLIWPGENVPVHLYLKLKVLKLLLISSDVPVLPRWLELPILNIGVSNKMTAGSESSPFVGKFDSVSSAKKFFSSFSKDFKLSLEKQKGQTGTERDGVFVRASLAPNCSSFECELINPPADLYLRDIALKFHDLDFKFLLESSQLGLRYCSAVDDDSLCVALVSFFLQGQSTLIVSPSREGVSNLFGRLLSSGVSPRNMLYWAVFQSRSSALFDSLLTKRLQLLQQVVLLCNKLNESAVYADSCQNAMSFYARYASKLSSEHGSLFEEINRYTALEVLRLDHCDNESFFWPNARIVGLSVSDIYAKFDALRPKRFDNLVILEASKVEKLDAVVSILSVSKGDWKRVLFLNASKDVWLI